MLVLIGKSKLFLTPDSLLKRGDRVLCLSCRFVWNPLFNLFSSKLLNSSLSGVHHIPGPYINTYNKVSRKRAKIETINKSVTLARPVFSRGYAKHRNDYLLGDRLCKCVTHSDVNFWPRTWRVWVWVSCEVFKAVRGMNFIAVVMYRSQQRSRQGQRIVTSQSQEVASCFLRFTRRGS